MLQGLDAVAWDELEHAYGYATDIPSQLRDFLAADDEGRRRLVYGWYGNLFHQGSRYSASPEAMPFLAELAESSGPRRGALVVLLVHLFIGYPEDHTVGYDPDEVAAEWGDEEGLLAGLAAAFERTVPALRRLLCDDDPWVREAAAFALAWHRHDRAPSAEALVRRLAVEDVPAARFGMLLALSFVDTDGSARAVLTDAVDAERPAADRLAAAIGLARSDPARCPGDAVAVLLDAAGGTVDVAAEFGGSSWHGGDLANLAAEALRLLGDPTKAAALDAAVAQLPGVINGADGLRAAAHTLELALGGWGGGPRDLATLTPRQRAALEALARCDGVWVFANVSATFAAYGLPDDRAALIAALGLDFTPDPEAVRRASQRSGMVPLPPQDGSTPAGPEAVADETADECVAEEAAAKPLPLVPAGLVATVVDCWRPDDGVKFVTASPTRVYLAGAFTSLGPRLPVPVLLDAAAAVVVDTQEFAPTPTAVVAADDGGFYVAGRPVGATGHGDVVRLTPDGRLDPTFRAPVRGIAHPSAWGNTETISRLAVGDGVLYAFGHFGRIGDDPAVPFLGVVGLDAHTGQPTGFRAEVLLQEMVAVPGRLVVGGNFTEIGGVPRPGVAAFDARTGELLDWTVAASWDSGLVVELAISGSTLYVTLRQGMHATFSYHAFDLDTGEARWHRTDFAEQRASILAVHSGRAYLALERPREGDPRILIVDAATWSRIGHVDVDGSVDDSAVRGYGTDARMVIAGDFTEVAGVARDTIAELRLADGAVTDFEPAVRRRGYGDWAAGARGVLVASPYLLWRSASPRRFLAALDLATGVPVSWPVAVDGEVSYLRYTADGTLWMVGSFTEVNGERRPGAAAVEAATGYLHAWAPRFNGDVTNMTYDAKRNRVYACGRFTKAGNQARRYVAAFDATTGRLLPWQVEPDNAVLDLAVDDDRVWLGGDFKTIGGQGCRRLAAVDAESGALLTAASASGEVRALCVVGPWLVAGGDFSRLSDAPRSCLGAIDRISGEVVPWDPAPVAEENRLPATYGLWAWDDMIWATGDFKTIGGHPRAGLAAFAVPSGALVDWQPPEELTPAVRLMPTGDHAVLLAHLVPDHRPLQVAARGYAILTRGDITAR